MTSHTRHCRLSLLTVLLVTLCIVLPAQATKRHNTGGNKIKFEKGSEEATKDRNSRLARECKGQVNAGACAGFTR